MKNLLMVLVSVLVSVSVSAVDVPCVWDPDCETLNRGDANADGNVNLSDSIFILNWLFQGGPAPICLDAADVNGDSKVDISDSDALLNYLYSSGQAPGLWNGKPVDGCSCTVDQTAGCSGSETRGDVNGDGWVDGSDLTFLVSWLDDGGLPPPCIEPCDFNGDGWVDDDDVDAFVNYLYNGEVGPVANTPGCP